MILLKKLTFFVILLLNLNTLFCFDSNSLPEIHPDPWSLIIYRPDSKGEINDIKCWLKLENAETNEDVTYTAAKATYEWASIPDKINYYKTSYYLLGGMAMHLQLKSGKYNITVFTPSDKTNLFKCENTEQWTSNVFYYDTKNPTNVIFVTPTIDKNGFFNGGWYIDYKSPKINNSGYPIYRMKSR